MKSFNITIFLIFYWKTCFVVWFYWQHDACASSCLVWLRQRSDLCNSKGSLCLPLLTSCYICRWFRFPSLFWTSYKFSLHTGHPVRNCVHQTVCSILVILIENQKVQLLRLMKTHTKNSIRILYNWIEQFNPVWFIIRYWIYESTHKLKAN